MNAEIFENWKICAKPVFSSAREDETSKAVFTRLNAVSDFVQPARERRITELIEYTGNINKR